LIEIKGAIFGGQLTLTWTYSANLHRVSTIESLAQSFLENLRALIAHCQSPGAGAYTPSDFPLAGLREDELAYVFDQVEFEGISGEEKRRNVEDAYPLSPMQEMTLFHSLFVPTAQIYVSQTTCRLSRLDASAFTAAWQQVIDLHPILRTAFVWKRVAKPFQAVGRRVAAPLEVLDWRDLPSEGQRERLAAYLEQERDKGFQLSRAPLMRIGLIRLSDESYQFVWTHHHALLDGWSAHRIFKEFSILYDGLRRGQSVAIEPSRPFRDYIAWLQRQDISAAENYWRRSLAGFTSPTKIGVADVKNGRNGERNFQEFQTKLPTQMATALKSLSQLHGLTFNTLAQGAWALALSGYTGEKDVIFGSVVSGRPPELPGVESIVGLLINTLPVRVRIDVDSSYVQWLETLQQQQAEMRLYEYSPLLQVQNWSDIAAGRPPFESILIYQNYPVDSLALDGGGLEVSEYRSYERSSYPVAIVVGGESWGIKIVYDASTVSDGEADRMLDGFINALNCMVISPNSKVSESESPDARTRLLGNELVGTSHDESEMFDFQI